MELDWDTDFSEKERNFQFDEELTHKQQCKNVGIAVVIVKTDVLVEEEKMEGVNRWKKKKKEEYPAFRLSCGTGCCPKAVLMARYLPYS